MRNGWISGRVSEGGREEDCQSLSLSLSLSIKFVSIDRRRVGTKGAASDCHGSWLAGKEGIPKSLVIYE